MKLKILIAILTIINLILIIFNIEFSGLYYHNDFNAKKYEIHGIDISHHQDRINWRNVDKKYKFVIIKATEGKDFSDIDFKYNWNKAQINGFYVGAYHFFTMTSSGLNQAKWYVYNVSKNSNSFGPILDIEISNRHNKKKVIKEITDFKNYVENYYNKKMIIYTNYRVYEKYIKDNLLDNKIWIRDIKKHPNLKKDDNRWIIWQYSNRGIVKGIKDFTDKNVLRFNDINLYIK